MSFALNDDQRMILQHVRDFCRAEIASRAAEYDREAKYPHEQLRGLADMGLLGATIPEQWGGAGLDSVTYALCLEEIATADSSVAVIVSVQNGLPEQMILKYGTDEQREKYLRPLASGQHIGAFCLTEPQAGSDAASLRLKAALQSGELGTIEAAFLSVPWWRPQSYYDEPGRGTLASELACELAALSPSTASSVARPAPATCR